MGSEQPEVGHEELKKMHDHGFGRAVKGFRTQRDAVNFLHRWQGLTIDEIRTLYPENTKHMDNTSILHQQTLIALSLQKTGIDGLLDLVGGSLHGLERILKGMLDATDGLITKTPAASLSSNAVILARDITLDIYIFGTGPTGVPDFDEFLAYRTAKSFGYMLEEKLDKKINPN